MIIQAPVYIESLSTRADNSIKIVLGTQELSVVEAAYLFKNVRQICNILIKPGSIKEIDIAKFKDFEGKETDPSKSPSRRMRSVYFILWKQDPEGYEDFNLYYQFKMNGEIDKLKEKIQD